MTSTHRYTAARRIAALMIVATLLTLSVFGTALADNAAISQAQQDAKDLRALIDELSADLSQLDEDYNYASQKLQDTRAQIKETDAQLVAAKADLTGAQEQLTERLVSIYKQGHTGALSVLLSADDFSDLVNRFKQLTRVGEQDSEILTQVEEYNAQVTAHQEELQARLADEKDLATQTEEAKQKVEQQLARQAELLKGKEAQIAQLEKEEEARQIRLAAAARAAAEQAALRAAAEPDQTETSVSTPDTTSHAGTTIKSTSTTKAPDTGSTTAKPTTSTTKKTTTTTEKPAADVPSSSTGARVVDIAMQYLNVPYVWAGSSPSGFDCSGLVMYVYAKVGINLPHSSRMMYEYGASVSRSNLQPGDLVFFYDPIHHVGIYIGDGQMVNARGSRVQIDDLWTNSYYGAKRVL